MAKKNTKKNKRKNRSSWRLRCLLVAITMSSLMAMPTSIVMIIGMLPTFTAFLVDRTSERTRVLTVGAMNLAGCTPFILRLWTSGHTIDNALAIMVDPRTIIVMYCAAGVGYLIDWSVSSLMATVMVGRATSRRAQIVKQQVALVERWGKEVTGEIPVDSSGFPLETGELERQEKK